MTAPHPHSGFRAISGRWMVVLALLVAAGCRPRPLAETPAHVPSNVPEPYRGVLVAAEQVSPAACDAWRTQAECVVLALRGGEHRPSELAGAELIQSRELPLEYFIEVGRSPELARDHPLWMASLQGHDAWRQRFPEFPQPTKSQIVKAEPWVPILYREAFAAHLSRIAELLKDMPAPRRIWLNDLQAAPSACGCGHPLCRWTADYGPLCTATPLGPTAAAEFVVAVQRLAPHTQVVPIFATECERDDHDTVCCGIDCYEGKCWHEWTGQLDPLAEVAPQIGVPCFYQLFERDLSRYGAEAAWVGAAVKSFAEMPPQRGGTAIPAQRLVCLLQGWEVGEAEVTAQIAEAQKSGAAGWLLVLTPIDQSWRPRLVERQ